MRRLLIATTALTLLVAPMGAAFAQGYDRHDDRNNAMTMQRHDDGRNDNRGNSYDHRGNNYGNRGWHKGGRIDRNDWNRGQRINDWNRYHLRRPPRGYEWRRVDNNYVLAAAATGLIMGLALANH